MKRLQCKRVKTKEPASESVSQSVSQSVCTQETWPGLNGTLWAPGPEVSSSVLEGPVLNQGL